MKLILKLLPLLLTLQQLDCAKILGIFTVPSKSHAILAYELFKELAKSGHEVSLAMRRENSYLIKIPQFWIGHGYNTFWL